MPIAADSTQDANVDTALDSLLLRLTGRLVEAAGNPSARVQAILAELRTALELDCVGLSLLPRDSDNLRSARHYHAGFGPCPARDLLTAVPALVEDLRRGQVVIYPRAGESLPEALAAARIGAALLLPLQTETRWIGTLGLVSERAGERWSQPVMTSLQTFGRILAGLLQHTLSDVNAEEAWMAMALEASGIDASSWNLVTGEANSTYHIAMDQSNQSPEHPFEPVQKYNDYLQLVNPEHRGRVLLAIEAAIKSAVSGGDPSIQFEYILVQPNGRQHWVEYSGRVRRDANGAPAVIEGALMDISKRKQVEQELNQQRQMLMRQTRLLEQAESVAAIGGWEWDIVNDILYFTPEMYRIYGFAPDSPLPPVEDLVQMNTPETRACLRAAIQQALATGQTYDLQMEIVNAEGQRIPVRATGRVEMEDGRAIRLFGTLQDITRTVSLERQLREARALYQTKNRIDPD